MALGCGRSGPAPVASGGSTGASLRRRRRGELLGQPGGSARGYEGERSQHHRESRHRSRTAISPPPAMRAWSPARTWRSSTAWATTTGPRKLLQASPARSGVVLNVGRLLGLERGRQPAPLVLPRRRGARDRRDRRRLRPPRPSRRGLLRRSRAAALMREPVGLRRASRTDPRSLRGRAGRLQREHLPGTGRRPRPAPADAPSFARAVAEGTDVTAADKQTVDAQAEQPSDRRVGLQQPERDAGCPAGQ